MTRALASALLLSLLLAACSRGKEEPPPQAASAPLPKPENIVIEEPAQPPPGAMLYRCEGDAQVSVAFLDAEFQRISVTLPGESAAELTHAESASGAKYANDTLVFLGKGDQATIERDGKTVFSGCTLQVAG